MGRFFHCWSFLAAIALALVSLPCAQSTVYPTCDKALRPRSECPGAYGGITEAACHALSSSCCWDTSTPNTAWCYSNQRPTCDGNARPREDCPGAYGGMTEATCRALNSDCCWDASVGGMPWCFRNPARARRSCDVSAKPRSECPGAYPGITESSCMSLSPNCCFDTLIPNVPWCFVNPSPAPVAPLPDEMVQISYWIPGEPTYTSSYA